MTPKRSLPLGLIVLTVGLLATIGLILWLALAPNQQTAVLPTSAIDSSQLNGRTLYTLDTETAVARFTIDEILRGAPKTVIGSTDQLAGEVALRYDDLGSIQFGPIQLLASTLQTDSGLRNTAIRERILFADTYPLITFVPSRASGLPASISVGETIEFELIGELTIRELTREETFVVVATAVSATEFTIHASTTLSRSDYDLQIPSVPDVANVGETLLLEIQATFVAQ